LKAGQNQSTKEARWLGFSEAGSLPMRAPFCHSIGAFKGAWSPRSSVLRAGGSSSLFACAQTGRDSLNLWEYALIFTAIRSGLREGDLAGLRCDIQFGDSDEDPDHYMLVQRNYDRRWSRSMLTPKSRKPTVT